MKFKVVIGSHTEDGKVFHQGEVVESSRDLAMVFLGKFVRLNEDNEEVGKTSPNPPRTRRVRSKM